MALLICDPHVHALDVGRDGLTGAVANDTCLSHGITPRR